MEDRTMGFAVTVYFDSEAEANQFSTFINEDTNLGAFQIVHVSDVVEEG
jgi:hypothetical protein